ncbi:MAG: hypothetical protein KKB51_06760 [Candidatus Riflebacteria bacterium]|nr:hypothetical protein [Candidatus Riflebacteria bacterium]
MRKLLLMVTILAILQFYCTPMRACEPEPGAQHFPTIKVPPPRIQAGYFSVYNSLNGLPCNNISSLLVQPMEENAQLVIAGNRDEGIMIFDGATWHRSGGDMFEFPAVTVSSLARIDSKSFLAGTSNGIFKGEIKKNKVIFSALGKFRDENLNVLAIREMAKKENCFYIACDRVAGTLQEEQFIPFKTPEYLSPTGFSAIIGCELGELTGCHGGLYRINNANLTPVFGDESQIGWVNDFANAEKRLFIASANGLFITSDLEKMENLLPGIWCTRAAFSAYPRESLSGSDKKAFEPKMGAAGITIEDDAFTQLRAQHAQLQTDYAAYTQRYAGQRDAPREAVDQMYERFFAFERQMIEASQRIQGTAEFGSDGLAANLSIDSSALLSPLLKGLWVGTQNSGLILFATDGERYHLTSENSKLPCDNITAIALGNAGEVWFGTETGGIMRYSKRSMSGKGKLQEILSCEPTRIRVLADLLYVGTRRHGMHIYQLNPIKSIGNFNDENVKGFHRMVTDFAMDKDGNLWVTGNAGVIRWDGKTWKNIEFRQPQTQMVGQTASRIVIDGSNRIFVAFAAAAKVYEQIFVYDGDKLSATTPQTISTLLQLNDKERYQEVRLHGLDGTYMRNFDFANASETLKNFEIDESAPVSAMLNTEHYLLVGMENGYQKIFDGESYKKLSEKGTGRIGAISNLFRLPSGIILIQGKDGVSEFDGQHYRLIESASTGQGFKINDMCIDQMNPETYRIAFTSSDGGGYALYQNGFWEKYYTKSPVKSIAQSDFIIFLAMPDGVYYLPE